MGKFLWTVVNRRRRHWWLLWQLSRRSLWANRLFSWGYYNGCFGKWRWRNLWILIEAEYRQIFLFNLCLAPNVRQGFFFFLTSSLRHPKILVKEFSYFLMHYHQHCPSINLLISAFYKVDSRWYLRFKLLYIVYFSFEQQKLCKYHPKYRKFQ